MFLFRLDKADKRALLLEKEKEDDKRRVEENNTEQYEVSQTQTLKTWPDPDFTLFFSVSLFFCLKLVMLSVEILLWTISLASLFLAKKN